MSDPQNAASAAAEAARYALLRRLAPSMRHHLVVNLQPIGMIYEVMDRRLRATTPDLTHVRDSAGKINGFAKAALASCVDVVGWLAPDDNVATAVPDPARADLVLSASAEAGAACLRVALRATPGDPGMSTELNYRRITWADLDALAAVDGVQLARDGDAIELRLPWVDAP